MATPSIPSASIALFKQTSSPPGWTKLTSDDDCALRITSGTVGSGGTRGFSTVFTNVSLSSSEVVAVTSLSAGSVAAKSPTHTHTGTQNWGSFTPGGGPPGSGFNKLPYYLGSTNGAGGSFGHTHSVPVPATLSTGFTASGSFDMTVKYVDVIVAQRN